MEEKKNPRIARFIEFYEKQIPFHKFLDIKVLELKKGYVKMRVPFRPEIVGDIRKGAWHGGAIATALDAAGGMAAASQLTSVEDNLATLDIRIDFLKTNTSASILVTGEVLRSGNRSIVTNLKAFDEASNTLLADGRAVFSVKRTKKTK